LVLIRGHGQDFQKAVGELDEAGAVVGQNEVLFLGPVPLVRKYFLEQILPFLGRRNFGRGLGYAGHGLALEKGNHLG